MLKVITLINSIPNNISKDDITLIDKCLEEYNKLTSAEQSLVTNYDELLKKKAKCEEIIANSNYEVKVELNGGYLENMIEIGALEKVMVGAYVKLHIPGDI